MFSKILLLSVGLLIFVSQSSVISNLRRLQGYEPEYETETEPEPCSRDRAVEVCENLGCYCSVDGYDVDYQNWIDECVDKVLVTSVKCQKRWFGKEYERCIFKTKNLYNDFDFMCQSHCSKEEKSNYCDAKEAKNECKRRKCKHVSKPDMLYYDWLDDCEEQVCKWQQRCDDRGFYSLTNCIDKTRGMQTKYNQICNTYCEDPDELIPYWWQ